MGPEHSHGAALLPLEWLLPTDQDCDIDGPSGLRNDQQLGIVPNLETVNSEVHESAELA